MPAIPASVASVARSGLIPLRVGWPTKTPGARGAASFPRRSDVLDRGTRQRTESVWRPARVIVCLFFCEPAPIGSGTRQLAGLSRSDLQKFALPSSFPVICCQRRRQFNLNTSPSEREIDLHETKSMEASTKNHRNRTRSNRKLHFRSENCFREKNNP
jgi:hypothetical protein